MRVRRTATVVLSTAALGLGGAAWAQVGSTTSTTTTPATTSTTRAGPLPPCLPGPPEQFGLPPTSMSVPCDPRGPQIDPNAPRVPLCSEIPGGAASGQLCVTGTQSAVEQPPQVRQPLRRTG